MKFLMDEMDIRYGWVKDQPMVECLARIFVENTDTSYISHGEVIDGRALDLNHWIPNLMEFMVTEFSTALGSPGPDRHFRLAYLTFNGSPVGLAFLTIEPANGIAILQDVVIDRSMRGKKLGKGFLLWLEQELKQIGISKIFLESGIHNEDAHQFFHKQGFETSSVVMLKNL